MSDLRKAAADALEMLGHCMPDKRYGDDYLEQEFAELNAVRKALRAALAEPEQSEPVAWMVMNGVVNYQLIGSKSAANALAIEMQKRHDLSGSIAAFHVHPLYTAAPRREPLSDEQVGMLTVFPGLHHVETPVLAAFIRHIEQAITGEKT